MRHQRTNNKIKGYPYRIITSMKKCKICLSEFEPSKPLQVTCSYKCGLAYARGFNKPKKAIPKVSKKRQEKDKIYLQLRKEFFALHEKCQICNFNKPTDVHHSYIGANRNKYYLEVSTWFALCRNCHNDVHDNPKDSREKGYIK